MSNFASRLREYRGKARLTQKQAASKLGLAERTWQDYETDKRRPTFEGLIALAAFFEIPVEFLIGKLNPDLCTIIEQIAGRESRTTQEQMELFLREAAESFMEENCLVYRADIEDVGTDEEYADYKADLRDACGPPETYDS